MKLSTNKRNIINAIIIFMVLLIIIWLIIQQYSEARIREKQTVQYNIQNLSSKINHAIEKENEKNEVIEAEVTKEYPKQEVIKKYKGYEVSSKLEIPKINLETYILQKYSEQALKVSVTKFWGVNANEVGNFCIAGHNFKNRNMFHNLKKINKGDKIFISDNTVGKVEYEVYDIYTVLPEDISCLEQNTNGNREITLITCTYDSQKRIIVKAKA